MDSHILANADAYAFAKKSNNSKVIELVKNAWSAMQRVAEVKIKEYKEEIKSLNMEDYEDFKTKYNPSNFLGANRA